MNINIKPERILFLDIETAVKDTAFSPDHELFPFFSNKYRKENLTEEEIVAKFYKEGALDPVYSEIVCVSTGYIHKDVLITKSFLGTETEIICNLLDAIEKFRTAKGSVLFSGWNIIDFDIPFIRKAYSKYYPMFEFPSYMSDFMAKPWDLEWTGPDRMGNEGKFLDTMKIFKGTSFRMSSMAEAAILMGLPSPKQDTDGSMVGELFRKGEIARIARYCEGDVLTSANILMKMLGMDVLKQVSKTDSKESMLEGIPEMPLLTKLINTGKLSKAELMVLKSNIKSIDKASEEQLSKIMDAIKTVIPDFEL